MDRMVSSMRQIWIHEDDRNDTVKIHSEFVWNGVHVQESNGFDSWAKRDGVVRKDHNLRVAQQYTYCSYKIRSWVFTCGGNVVPVFHTPWVHAYVHVSFSFKLWVVILRTSIIYVHLYTCVYSIFLLTFNKHQYMKLKTSGLDRTI